MVAGMCQTMNNKSQKSQNLQKNFKFFHERVSNILSDHPNLVFYKYIIIWTDRNNKQNPRPIARKKTTVFTKKEKILKML